MLYNEYILGKKLNFFIQLMIENMKMHISRVQIEGQMSMEVFFKKRKIWVHAQETIY